MMDNAVLRDVWGRNRHRGDVLPEMRNLSCPSAPAAPREGTATGGTEAPLLGAISVGAILIIFAVTYLRYPIDMAIITEYFERMARQGMFLKPPMVLLDIVIFFVSALGVWTIVLSGLRVLVQKAMRTAITDLLGGLFCFLLAFLVSNYARDVLTGRIALAYIIITFGLLVILNVVIRFVLSDQR